jgi:hypothetical protein
MNSISRREGTSDFLDKVVDQVATAESTGTKKTASTGTNHPAEKAAAATSAITKTNHPAEKVSSDKAVKKEAGEVKGPGVPDGTGPHSGTEECQLNEEKTAKDEMTLHQVRVARRQGKFVKVAGRNDLYQEANTDSYWKISEDKSKVVRAFNENNGLVAK